MHVASYAKANLYLKIGKKLKSGYHHIQSVMQLVQLHDMVTFERLKTDDIIIESNNKELESTENLVYKAADILRKDYKKHDGMKITLQKAIPISAGLGGGSSNAATTLLTLQKLWKLKVSQKKMIEYGMRIGSDVPFFVVGQSSLVEGTGDKVKMLPKGIPMNVVLVNPGTKVSTEWAYKEFDKLKKKEKAPPITKVLDAIKKKDVKGVAKNMHNDFDPIVEKKHPIVSDIKRHFRKFDAINSIVTGSGATVMGVFDSIYVAREAYFKLKDLYPFVYLTKTF